MSLILSGARAALICFLAVTGAAYAGSQTYRYDADGRLIGVDYGSGEKVDYPVDDIGNRTDAIKTAAPPSTIAFSSASANVAEGLASITLSVVRIGSTSTTASVRCFTSNGTAVSGSDYVNTSTVLNWGIGDSTAKNCTVPIANDSATETDEAFTVALDSAAGAVVVSPSTATVTIRDDEAKAVLAFTSSAANKSENMGGSATVFVRRTGGSVGIVTVQYATSNGSAVAGSDYTAVNGTLTWADNDMNNKAISIPVHDDSTPENDETFSVTLSGPTGPSLLGSPATVTVQIICNDGYNCP